MSMAGAVVDLDHLQLAIPPGRDADARTFYGDLLGLEEIAKPATLAARGGVWYRLGSRQLHLGVQNGFVPARKAHPAFVSADLAKLRARIEAAGHDTRDDVPIAGRQRFFAADPFGNRLEFLSYERREAAQ